MRKMTEKKGKDLLIGAVVGTVLGAVTALLFAPKSGRELRSDIAEGVQNLTEKTTQVAGSVADKSKQLAGTITEKTQHTAQIIGKHTSEWAGKAKETALSWKNGRAETSLAEEAPVAATHEEENQ
jgi:gas vesicle protein